MNFLFDENLPHRLALAVGTLHGRDYPDGRVVSVRDQAWEGYEDRDWIHLLAGSCESWAILTRDKMRNEIDLIRQGNLTWVIMHRGWAKIPYWEVSWKLIKAWPEIVGQTITRPGQTYRLQINGKLAIGI